MDDRTRAMLIREELACEPYENVTDPGSSDTRTPMPTESTEPAPASDGSEPSPEQLRAVRRLASAPTDPVRTAGGGTLLQRQRIARAHTFLANLPGYGDEDADLAADAVRLASFLQWEAERFYA